MEMSINPNIAEVASLLGEASRVSILTSLMDGRFHTATELAYMAGIKPQTASFHLLKLVEGNIIKVDKQGRHRYYQLANAEVAHVLELFLAMSPPPEIRSLKQSSQVKLLQNARTCFDHLAGKLGVGITESMLNEGYFIKEEKDFLVTNKGEQFLTDIGINLDETKRKRRSFSHACLDWSERRHHIGGALGNGLMRHFFDLGWILQVDSIRAVKVTDKGKKEFKTIFNIQV
jgi:DNA-binding transcriptional ArsR family regulator